MSRKERLVNFARANNRNCLSRKIAILAVNIARENYYVGNDVDTDDFKYELMSICRRIDKKHKYKVIRILYKNQIRYLRKQNRLNHHLNIKKRRCKCGYTQKN